MLSRLPHHLRHSQQIVKSSEPIWIHFSKYSLFINELHGTQQISLFSNLTKAMIIHTYQSDELTESIWCSATMHIQVPFSSY